MKPLKKKKILFIIGTRPEAIKLAPVAREFRKHPKKFDVGICFTAQHREMLDEACADFDLKPDFDLNLMRPGQTLSGLTSEGLEKIGLVLEAFGPDLIFVQGDTTTAFVGALAGYYRKIKVAHVEAGLRSGRKYSPFPEELNRVLIDHIADYYFAPTRGAMLNLRSEGIKRNVWVVGNTGIDALALTLTAAKKKGSESARLLFTPRLSGKRILLVTCHRRESFGKPLRNICGALKELAREFKDLDIVYPVHLNPNVRGPVSEILKDSPNIRLLPTLPYRYFVRLLAESSLVLTDSGGIQEEAPYLGKPVLVMRDTTERGEGVRLKTAKIVGTDRHTIVKVVGGLLRSEKARKKMAKIASPYGDGRASGRIVGVIKRELC